MAYFSSKTFQFGWVFKFVEMSRSFVMLLHVLMVAKCKVIILTF